MPSVPSPSPKSQVTNLRTNSPYLNYARGGAPCYFQSSSDSFVSTTSHNQIHKYVVIFVLALRADFLLGLFSSLLTFWIYTRVGESEQDRNYSDVGNRSGVNYHVFSRLGIGLACGDAVWPRGWAQHMPTLNRVCLGFSCCSSTGGGRQTGEAP